MIRYISTAVYWMMFLYLINYTIDIIIQIEKECRKKKMDNFMRIKCFLTNIKLVIAAVCCLICYYIAYYSPTFNKGSLLDKTSRAAESAIENVIIKQALK